MMKKTYFGIPHFKGLGMRNLQHQITSCQNSHNSVSIEIIKIDVLGSGEFHGFANIARIKQECWNPPYISHLGWYLGSLFNHFQSPKSKIAKIVIFAVSRKYQIWAKLVRVLRIFFFFIFHPILTPGVSN